MLSNFVLVQESGLVFPISSDIVAAVGTCCKTMKSCRYQFEHSNVNFVRLDYKITNDYIGYYSLWSKRKRSIIIDNDVKDTSYFSMLDIFYPCLEVRV